MNKMSPKLRKAVLTIHVTTSVGWLGAAATYLVVTIAALGSGEVLQIRSAFLVMEIIAWFAVLPLALISLMTGLACSLGTKWGLFRHYWVVIKLVLTIVATIALLINMQDVNALAHLATEGDITGSDGLWGQVIHSGGGLVFLLVATALAVFKPRGLTRYGRRKQREARRSR